MNKAFDILVKSSIEKCVDDYKRLPKELFVNSDGKIVNPPEYGFYREKIIARLLKRFIPARYDIGTGFIITANNHISTQCDLIIYDKENTPVLENENQRFFPIESVAGVVEVKSKITKSELKDALIKLSNIKKLRENVEKSPYIFKDKNEEIPFNTKINVRDQIATFLVCEKFNFDPKECIDTFFKDVYLGIDKSLFHNMILSIDDGCYLYSTSKGHFYYPYISYINDNYLNSFVFPHELGYKYEHISLFVNYFAMCISSVSIFYVEITNYLGPSRIKQSVVEKNSNS